jgi:hypothetical protein
MKKIDYAVVVAEYESGDSSTEIAARHGLHRTHVCSILRSNGVNMRGRHPGMPRRQEAKRLLASGKTIAETAVIMGCSPQNVAWLASRPD